MFRSERGNRNVNISFKSTPKVFEKSLFLFSPFSLTFYGEVMITPPLPAQKIKSCRPNVVWGPFFFKDETEGKREKRKFRVHEEKLWRHHSQLGKKAWLRFANFSAEKIETGKELFKLIVICRFFWGGIYFLRFFKYRKFISWQFHSPPALAEWDSLEIPSEAPDFFLPKREVAQKSVIP